MFLTVEFLVELLAKERDERHIEFLVELLAEERDDAAIKRPFVEVSVNKIKINNLLKEDCANLFDKVFDRLTVSCSNIFLIKNTFIADFKCYLCYSGEIFAIEYRQKFIIFSRIFSFKN